MPPLERNPLADLFGEELIAPAAAAEAIPPMMFEGDPEGYPPPHWIDDADPILLAGPPMAAGTDPRTLSLPPGAMPTPALAEPPPGPPTASPTPAPSAAPPMLDPFVAAAAGQPPPDAVEPPAPPVPWDWPGMEGIPGLIPDLPSLAEMAGDDPIGAKAASLARRGEASARAARAQVDIRRRAEAAIEAQQEESRRQAEEGRALMRRVEGEIESEAKAISDSRVDPGRLFKDMGTGRKITSLIGIALGGFLAPLQGGRNQALELLLKTIDRDIDAQLANLQNRRAGLDAKRSLLNEIAGRVSNEQTASALLRGEMLGRAARQAETAALQARSDDDREKALQLATDLYAMRDAAVAAGGRAEAENALEWYKAQTARKSVGAQYAAIAQREKDSKREYDLATRAADAAGDERRAKLLAAERERAVWDVTEVDPTTGERRPVIAPSVKVAEEVNATIAGASTLVSGLDRLAAIYGAHGWESEKLGSDAAREATTILEDAKTTYAVLKGQGAISDGDRASYDRIFGKDPTGIRDMRAKWRAMRDRTIRNVNDQIRGRLGAKNARWSPDPEGFEPGGFQLYTGDDLKRMEDERRGKAADDAARDLFYPPEPETIRIGEPSGGTIPPTPQVYR